MVWGNSVFLPHRRQSSHSDLTREWLFASKKLRRCHPDRTAPFRGCGGRRLYCWSPRSPPPDIWIHNYRSVKNKYVEFQRFKKKWVKKIIGQLHFVAAEPLWTGLVILIWKLFSMSGYRKYINGIWFWHRNPNFGLKKSWKAKKGHKGQWRPAKAKKVQNSKNL